ncbi:hypothetical protein TNCT_299731 [Trichonephila clavata]|uniref:Uncharacterized protein n=1 Tax=Trichonephila clavata TaxID=2740835 RepID=A0A8X6K5F0_TRICU|nr:hypothetical protein TNCT_299731 [Trichonephila clavata]
MDSPVLSVTDDSTSVKTRSGKLREGIDRKTTKKRILSLAHSNFRPDFPCPIYIYHPHPQITYTRVLEIEASSKLRIDIERKFERNVEKRTNGDTTHQDSTKIIES